MAITGTLLADFTSFDDAAKKTEARLEGMAKAAGGMTAEVTKTDQALTGLGATATTTTSPALTTVGTAATTSTGKVLTFQQSFQQVDKTLAAVGVNLGPIPGAISEIGAAAGKTAGQLGALGTAGLITGAAITGWQIGTKVGEWTGWTDAIGRATAKLLGWGDVAAQEAAAGADTLARATAIAGREITAMDEAIRIITGNTKAATTAANEHVAELNRTKLAAEQAAVFSGKLFSLDDIARADTYLEALGRIENVTRLTAEKKKELRTALGDALAAYAALGDQAPTKLQRVYDATTDLITITRSFSTASAGTFVEYKAGLDDSAAKAEVDAARMSLAVKATEQPWRDLGGVSRAELQAIADTAATKYATALAHSDHFTAQQIADFQRAATEAQAAADAWGTALEQQYDAVTEASTRSADRQVAQAQRVSLSWSEAMDAVRRGEGTMTGTIGTPTKPADISDAEWRQRLTDPRAWEQQHQWDWQMPAGGNWRTLPGFGGSGISAPAATAAAPGGVTTSVTVNGSVLGNAQELARVVGDAVMSSLRASGVRLPAGA